MRLIRDKASGELQCVENLDGYDMALFDDLGEVPEGVDPMRVALDEAGVIVEDVALWRSTRSREIEARAQQCFLTGFAPDHPAFEGERLQLRDDTDRTNWLASAQVYSAAVAQGAGAVEGAVFRTANNTTVTVSYADGFAVLLAMQAWGAAIMQCSWRLKDAVAAAADAGAVQAIDVESEAWPS